jgi:hypothetical protein
VQLFSSEHFMQVLDVQGLERVLGRCHPAHQRLLCEQPLAADHLLNSNTAKPGLTQSMDTANTASSTVASTSCQSGMCRTMSAVVVPSPYVYLSAALPASLNLQSHGVPKLVVLLKPL